MKIAVDCRMSGKSGIGAFIDGILPYFVKSNNELLLIGLTENKIPDTLKNIKISDYKIQFSSCDVKTFSLKELLFFPKNISKKINKCDFYFTPYCNIPSGIKIPIFSTIHDIVFLDIPGLSSEIGTFIRKCFYQYAIFRSKAIFTVSNFSADRIKTKLLCNKPVYVVYSALPEYLLTTNSDIKKDNTLIFIGNIKKHKGFSTLLPAFQKFNEELKNNNKKTARLIIVGSQENFRTQDNSITQLIQNTNSNDIEFTGYISDKELQEKLSKAKILVQPSTYEGFGLPPLQALYCRTNTIISDIPVFKEIYEKFPVTYFETNNINDLAEKIAQVWNNPEPLEKIPDIYSFSKTTSLILSHLN